MNEKQQEMLKKLETFKIGDYVVAIGGKDGQHSIVGIIDSYDKAMNCWRGREIKTTKHTTWPKPSLRINVDNAQRFSVVTPEQAKENLLEIMRGLKRRTYKFLEID